MLLVVRFDAPGHCGRIGALWANVGIFLHMTKIVCRYYAESGESGVDLWQNKGETRDADGGFSAVLAEFSTSTAENSASTADFRALRLSFSAHVPRVFGRGQSVGRILVGKTKNMRFYNEKQ